MNLPVISIVIPSYNQAAFIERTLLSILGQDYPGKIEIIVSDGGSKDGTPDVLKKYNHRITWWSEKDEGYADAVNKGFAKATGDIFAIQSSDDYYLQGAVKNAVRTLNDHPDCILSCGREAVSDPQGNVFSGYLLPEFITPESFLLDHPFPGIFQHTTFFRREAFLNVKGLRKEFDMCADADLFYRMLHFGNGIFIRDFTSVYQRHEAQRTVTQTLKFKDQLLGMVLNCKNDPFYADRFCLNENGLNRYKTFLGLFFAQYEDPQIARSMAEEIISSTVNDKRTLDLAGNILKPVTDTSSPPRYSPSSVVRSLKRKLRKFRQPASAEKSFSEQISADWWKTLANK